MRPSQQMSRGIERPRGKSHKLLAGKTSACYIICVLFLLYEINGDWFSLISLLCVLFFFIFREYVKICVKVG